MLMSPNLLSILQESSAVTRSSQPPLSLSEHRRPWLATHLQTHITLVWTDNRTSMLSIKGTANTGYQIRLHHMFHDAPDAVWHALVVYIRHADEAARHILRTYIQHQRHRIRDTIQHRQRRHVLQPKGQYFDLEAIYHGLNQRYLDNRIEASITWARRPPKRPRTSIRFGSYHATDRLIRIHRLLDQSFVPPYVVENVVFHEMLHELIPRQFINGRWRVHPPAFRQAEQRFPYHQQAEQWQQQNLDRLLWR
jgi:hypothetical protein